MATILVTVRRVLESNPGGPVDILEAAGHTVRHRRAGSQTPAAELIDALQGCEAVIAITEPYTAEVFAGAPQLRHISRVGVGFDAVDLDAATAHGVVVTNTPGANANAVADHTVGLLVSVARWIPFHDHNIRQGVWQGRIGADVWQQTLGIVGLGNIGRGVARRMRGFDMQILAYDPFPNHEFAREYGVEFVSLEQVFAQSDFVTLHLPASAETAKTVNAHMLSLMKPTAHLINAARGALVDEDALYDALKNQKIAGAALDVRTIEPPSDVRFHELHNVVLTPHNAGSTPRALAASVRDAAENVVKVLRGERPVGLVNPEVWDRYLASLRSSV